MFRDIKFKLVFKRCIRGTLCVREEEINAHRDAIPVSNKNCTSMESIIRYLW